MSRRPWSRPPSLRSPPRQPLVGFLSYWRLEKKKQYPSTAPLALLSNTSYILPSTNIQEPSLSFPNLFKIFWFNIETTRTLCIVERCWIFSDFSVYLWLEVRIVREMFSHKLLLLPPNTFHTIKSRKVWIINLIKTSDNLTMGLSQNYLIRLFFRLS